MYYYATQGHESESTLLSKILSFSCLRRGDTNGSWRHGILKKLCAIPQKVNTVTEMKIQILQLMTGTCPCRFKLLHD